MSTNYNLSTFGRALFGASAAAAADRFSENRQWFQAAAAGVVAAVTLGNLNSTAPTGKELTDRIQEKPDLSELKKNEAMLYLTQLIQKSESIDRRLTRSGFSDNAVQELRAWILEKIGTSEGENRWEALSRILECKETGAKELILCGLGLTRFPKHMGELGNLLIDLSTNQITDIASLLHLDRNCTVVLPENPLSDGWDARYDYHAHPIIYDDRADRELEAWVNDAAPGEHRDTAADRLRRCYAERSLSLNLDRLNLCSLPTFILRCKSITLFSAKQNHLSSLPDGFFNSLNNLKVLDVFSNKFEAFSHDLPEYIEQVRLLENPLNITGKIYFDSRFEIRNEAFKESFQRLPLPDDENTDLDTALAFWNYEFDLYDPMMRIDGAIFHELEESNTKPSFAKFFSRLTDTADYREDRGNMILRVHRILKSAVENEDFRNKMVDLAVQGVTTCGDQAATYFNQIEVEWKIMCESASLNKMQLAELAIGVQRNELLQPIMEKKLVELKIPLAKDYLESLSLKDLQEELSQWLAENDQPIRREDLLTILRLRYFQKQLPEWYTDRVNNLPEDVRKDLLTPDGFFENSTDEERSFVIQKIETDREELFIDDIEVFLKYRLTLKKALKLPIQSQRMLYGACAASITNEMIETAKTAVLAQTRSREQIVKTLAESKYWAEKIEAENPATFEQIREEYSEDFETISEEIDSGIERDRAQENRAKQLKEELAAKVLALTNAWLNADEGRQFLTAMGRSA